MSTIDVRAYIQTHYTPYDGDESFLAPATGRTRKLWEQLLLLMAEEQKKGILDLDVSTPSSVVSHPPGYIDKDKEVIVGLQTDAPLKRAIKPNGGIKLVQKAAAAYGYEIHQDLVEMYTKVRLTHNDAVFKVYTKEQRLLRKKHIVTGLPDNYGRGRIIGDYRRIALYGIEALIKDRLDQLDQMPTEMSEEHMHARWEVAEQIRALQEIAEMATSYGFDITKPATDSKEAVQWLYFGYLAAVKEQDGAAMSMGRIDAFLDTYFEQDLVNGIYTEEQIQEMVDDFVIKCRIVRHLRPPEYDALFAGDPTWVTIVLGGTGIDGRHMVTKTAYRFLHTLSNLGPAPEPNMTVLWSKNLPKNWKQYCSRMSIETSSIQYENDDLMKPYYGDDYGIACCVSGMTIGRDMQFFGARANGAKVLLLAINGGREEPLAGVHEGGDVVVPDLEPFNKTECLDYEEVWGRFVELLDWLAERYVGIMNVIHYMHDRYNYEATQMALHDVQVRRFMAFGLAGLSVIADSLSAIKYAKVRPIWNSKGVAERFEVAGEYPTYGNDDDRVDQIAIAVAEEFIKALRRYDTYRNAVHTLSILTITSNVVYGQSTGATPDGRASGVPFAPGANPMHGRDYTGALASLNSVAKLPYDACQDGISNTFSLVPGSLGKGINEQKENLTQVMDGYFVGKGAHHLNVNVFNRQTLKDAQEHPEQYPQLTIRVSGYAVLFNRLSKKQQDEVIERTFHERM
ncbi:MAG: formate C-acetyltransferase [Patescibacteria group bacterium]